MKRALPVASHRLVRWLTVGLAWDPRRGPRWCFPRLSGRARADCCSPSFGPNGNDGCWQALPQTAPWYYLCCGAGLRRVLPLRRVLALLEPTSPAFRRRSQALPQDTPCLPPMEGDRCAVYFLAYRKTGNQLLGERLLPILVDILVKRDQPNLTVDVWYRSPWSTASIFTRMSADWERVYHVQGDGLMLGLPLPPSMTAVVQLGEWLPDVKRHFPGRFRGRVVHMVRSPVDIVASTFRNLKRAGFIGPLQDPLECYGCSQHAWHFIFRRCSYQCRFMELFQSSRGRPLLVGVEMAYAMSQRNIQNMLNNIATWSEDSGVLHLSVEQFHRNLTQTITCLAKFIFGTAAEGTPRSWSAPTELVEQVLRQVRASAQSKRWHVPGHVTYNNPKLSTYNVRDAVLLHPDWGTPARRAEIFVNRVLARQANLYGCPTPR